MTTIYPEEVVTVAALVDLTFFCFFCFFNLSDKLREGDELLEVNGIAVAGKRTEDIIHLMVRACRLTAITHTRTHAHTHIQGVHCIIILYIM